LVKLQGETSRSRAESHYDTSIAAALLVNIFEAVSRD
jgi:hypothetical protein